MSKIAYVSRYFLIVKKLKSNPYATFEEIEAHIKRQLSYYQLDDNILDMGFSKRTFQRDIKDIRETFGLDICYSATYKGYFLQEGEGEKMNFQKMMEAYDLYNALKIGNSISPFIHIQRRAPNGTDYLVDLIHAIKNKLHIEFQYHSFNDDSPKHRKASPLAIKEFKDRWYLIAENNKYNNIKTYALDRLSGLEITNQRFAQKEPFDIEAYFKNCFGIITPKDQKVEEIILSFTPEQGKYAKTLPLHPNQKILVDNHEMLQIKLELYVTHDLIMELLSYGDQAKVLQPLWLAQEIKSMHKNAHKQY